MLGIHGVLVVVCFVGSAIAFNETIGGKRLKKMPDPYLVLITEVDPWSDDPQPDCVAVSAGNFTFGRSLLFTSYQCVPLEKARLRSAKHELIEAAQFELPDQPKDKFRIAFLEVLPSQDASIPQFAELITDKAVFQQHLAEKESQGFALAVHQNPVLALVVTLNQKGCADVYAKLKLPNWPENIREGAFCVFPGRTAEQTRILGHLYKINGGTPCDDAEGSPVLSRNFTKVLGIIVKTFCGYDIQVAFAMSTAYLPSGFEPATLAPTTTISPPTLPPPPPYPRFADPVIPCSSSKPFGDLRIWTLLALWTSKRLVKECLPM